MLLGAGGPCEIGFLSSCSHDSILLKKVLDHDGNDALFVLLVCCCLLGCALDRVIATGGGEQASILVLIAVSSVVARVLKLDGLQAICHTVDLQRRTGG